MWGKMGETERAVKPCLLFCTLSFFPYFQFGRSRKTGFSTAVPSPTRPLLIALGRAAGALRALAFSPSLLPLLFNVSPAGATQKLNIPQPPSWGIIVL